MTRAEAQKFTSANQVVRSSAPAKPMTRAEAQKYTSRMLTVNPVNPPARVTAPASPYRNTASGPTSRGVQTPSQGVSSWQTYADAGITALSAGAAGFEGNARLANMQARASAAAVLTKGGAGRLPAPAPHGTNAALANSITGKGSLPNKLSYISEVANGKGPANFPYSAASQSGQKLAEGMAKVASSAWTKVVSKGLTAAELFLGGVTGFFAKKGDVYDKLAAGVTGAAMKVDNVVVSLGGGAAAGFGTTFVTGGAGLPAAPVVAVAGGVAANEGHKFIGTDAWMDRMIAIPMAVIEPVIAVSLRSVGTSVGMFIDGTKWLSGKVFGSNDTPASVNNTPMYMSNSLVPYGLGGAAFSAANTTTPGLRPQTTPFTLSLPQNSMGSR